MVWGKWCIGAKKLAILNPTEASDLCRRQKIKTIEFYTSKVDTNKFLKGRKWSFKVGAHITKHPNDVCLLRSRNRRACLSGGSITKAIISGDVTCYFLLWLV